MTISLPMVLLVSALGCSSARAPQDAFSKLARQVSCSAPEGWQKQEARTFVGNRLTDYIDGGAIIFMESGFQRLLLTSYLNCEKDKQIVIEIYQMTDSPAAFGIYSYSRQPDSKIREVGNQGFVYTGNIEFWKGAYYVRIRTLPDSPNLQEDVKNLACKLAAGIPNYRAEGWEKLQLVLSWLPGAGRMPNSEKYFRGALGFQHALPFWRKNILQVNEHTEGVCAIYPAGTAFVISYPSRTEAQKAMKLLKRWLQNSSAHSFQVDKEDAKKALKYESEGKFLVGVVTTPDNQGADRLLSQVLADLRRQTGK